MGKEVGNHRKQFLYLEKNDTSCAWKLQRKLLSGRQKDPIELQESIIKNSYYFRIYILFCISTQDFNKYRESFVVVRNYLHTTEVLKY